VTVPNAIAKKILDGTYRSWNRHGDLYYEDEKGEVHIISGHCGECDFTRAEDEEWDEEGSDSDDTESDTESDTTDSSSTDQ
jgi:hypothetical protein